MIIPVAMRFRETPVQHPEHDGYDESGRRYYAGNGMGDQVAAGF